MAFDCQELLRSILDPEMTHTLYDGQWMMVVDVGCDGGGGWVKCERGGVPRDKLQELQTLLFIG